MEQRELTAKLLRDGCFPGDPCPSLPQACCPGHRLSDESPASPETLSIEFIFQSCMMLEMKGTLPITRLGQQVLTTPTDPKQTWSPYP